MSKTEQTQRAEDIYKTGQRVGILISESHAKLVAKSSASLYDAIDTVRSLEYQGHEPCNVFHPVVLVDGSYKRGVQ